MKKIYLVPNLVTTANLFCGFYSLLATLQGDFLVAAWAIVAGSVFDLLDGRIARLAKATSQFGVEYDSLSDLLSFGVAPALLVYQWALLPWARVGWLVAFLYLTCGALRLARFNASAGGSPKAYFQGLPIPMAAGLIASFVLFHQVTEWPVTEDLRQEVVFGLTLGLAGLMVSSVPFPSFKNLNWRSQASVGLFLLGMGVLVGVAWKPEWSLFLVGCAYLGLSLLWSVYQFLFGRKTASPRGVLSSRGLH
jgi:CDP-diacylglycerol--serine O-phosphatidyltransferase